MINKLLKTLRIRDDCSCVPYAMYLSVIDHIVRNNMTIARDITIDQLLDITQNAVIIRTISNRRDKVDYDRILSRYGHSRFAGFNIDSHGDVIGVATISKRQMLDNVLTQNYNAGDASEYKLFRKVPDPRNKLCIDAVPYILKNIDVYVVTNFDFMFERYVLPTFNTFNGLSDWKKTILDAVRSRLNVDHRGSTTYRLGTTHIANNSNESTSPSVVPIESPNIDFTEVPASNTIDSEVQPSQVAETQVSSQHDEGMAVFEQMDFNWDDVPIIGNTQRTVSNERYNFHLTHGGRTIPSLVTTLTEDDNLMARFNVIRVDTDIRVEVQSTHLFFRIVLDGGAPITYKYTGTGQHTRCGSRDLLENMTINGN